MLKWFLKDSELKMAFKKIEDEHKIELKKLDDRILELKKCHKKNYS